MGTAVRNFRAAKNKAKWKSFKKKAAFHQNIMKVDNSNATAEEKQSASKIEAAFKGRKALHDRIAKEGTTEQKEKLARVEQKRDDRLSKKKGKKKKEVKKQRTKRSSLIKETRTSAAE